jgi:hypothetical protein
MKYPKYRARVYIHSSVEHLRWVMVGMADRVSDSRSAADISTSVKNKDNG